MRSALKAGEKALVTAQSFVMKKKIKSLIKRLPPIKHFLRKRDDLINIERTKLKELQSLLYVPPGHFYSPIPAIDELKQNEELIFRVPEEIAAVDLNVEEQLRYFEAFKQYYKDLPFKDEATEGLRYYFNNPNYSYSDAICLYALIRHTRPQRIIEVGSGYSSCVMLDTNELFFSRAIEFTFIEPHPQLLLSLMKESDKEKVKIIPRRLQDVGLEEFSSLEADDVLFVDSTHVSKVNSDVNHIFFEVLPSLKTGVYIHFHDVFYPFEYPREWVSEGRAWNEDYLLRAFLQYNSSFKIVFFNTFLEHFFAEKFIAEMPLCMKNIGGSIWLRKC